jgi:phosphatidate phosphatase APP1
MHNSRPPGFPMRFLLKAERRADRLMARARGPYRGPPVIEPYLGYATPEGLLVRGRVLRKVKSSAPKSGQGWSGNLRQMTGLFMTRELPGIRVTAGGVSTRSDGEGYFSLVIPGAAVPGWQKVTITADRSEATADVLVPQREARFGVISDIDDTLMQTGAWSLFLNLKTTLTGNIETRVVFSDAVALVHELAEGGRNPIYYVSSTPWNMHGFLSAVFARAGLVRGPFFLRDMGLGENQVIAARHGSHKGAAIDRLLQANPGLGFVVLGDTGQHDAKIYAAAAIRHPGRILRIILRHAVRPADETALTTLGGLGIRVDVVDDFAGLMGGPWPIGEGVMKPGAQSAMTEGPTAEGESHETLIP